MENKENKNLEFNLELFSNIGQTSDEARRLFTYLKQTEDIIGDVVEAGVWAGISSKLLNTYKSKNKKLLLFDTFEGLKDCSEEKDGNYLKDGVFSFESSSEDWYSAISEMFKNDQNVELIKGYFPMSAEGILDNRKLSFVHLDMDTYRSTLEGLEYCYSKMSLGGVIVVHDYINNPSTMGVHRAVNEFLSDKEESVIIPDGPPPPESQGRLGNSQGIIIKL